MGRHSIVVGLVAIALGLPAPLARAQAAAPVAGAGSTWAQNAIDQLRRDVSTRSGLTIQYAATGSSDGRAQFRTGTVGFAVSELEYGLPDSADPPPDTRGFTYLPVLAGGLALAYNLQAGGARVRDLRLSGDTAARIFTRAITRWDDPAIRLDNPGLALPAQDIVVVVRSDTTGVTRQLTGWFAERHAAVWADFCARAGRPGCPPTAGYPVLPGLVAAAGGAGAAGRVDGTPGSITYVESSYARNAGLPVANLRNDAGAYVAPTAGAVTAALRTVAIRADHTQDPRPVWANPDPAGYPLSGYAYAIVPTDTRAGFTPDQGRTLAAFLSAAVCTPQSTMDSLGHAALPPNLVRAAADQITRIPGAASTPDCATTSGTEAQEVTLEVLPGALTITVADPDVTLAPPTLTPDAAMRTTTGRLNPIRVTDTRAGNPGWNLTGQTTDFTDAGANRINGANLGWTPELLAAAPAQDLTIGPLVTPAPALQPGADPPPGIGLRTGRTLAIAAPGAGAGTADLTAALALTVPTATPAGTYTATLTLTVI